MAMIRSSRIGRFGAVVAVLLVAAVVIFIYYPIAGAGFVWDDRIFLQDDASLRASNGWIRSIFGIFFDAQNYFRPASAALLVGEMRVFATSASAMHLVSLALHVGNTLLVGVVARLLLGLSGAANAHARITCAAMLIYGLHPLLIEPIAWIACQVELLLTFFVLLGLIANLAIRNTWVRAGAVSACFFLAACSKEAAIAFPLLLFVVDWLRFDRSTRRVGAEPLTRQAAVYVAIILAGIGYLALRKWGLGYLVAPSSVEAVGALARFQLVCETYVTYWKMIVWPMNGLDPLHEYLPHHAHITFGSVANDLAALALFAVGMYQLARRHPSGGLIVGTSVLLLPVMHVLPVEIDDSLYHERWAMTATAIACAFLPAAWSTLDFRRFGQRRVRLFASIMLAFWLVVAVFNIRVTLPLWANEVRLWEWALHDNPHSVIAQDNLLAQYVQNGDLSHARPMAKRFLAEHSDCLNCLLNAAQVAILDRDTESAKRTLERAEGAMKSQPPSVRQMVNYVSKIGDIRRLQGDFAGAETAYRDAIRLDPMIPVPHLSLATALAKQGKIAEARRAADEGFRLLTPDRQQRSRLDFEAFLEKTSAGATR